MSHILPLELICHVFSFLQYHDLYLTRGVSRLWRSMVEEHIYLTVKRQQQSVTITIGQSPFTSTLELYVDSYDPFEKVVMFKPKQEYIVSSCMGTTTTTTTTTALGLSSWQLYHHRQMQIRLNPTCSNSNHSISSFHSTSSSSWLQALSQQEQEQALLHLQYNPVMERSYALPAYSWLTTSMAERVDQHYIGDKTLILSFSYIQPPFTSGEFAGTPGDKQSDLSSMPSTPQPPPTTSLCAPQIKIQWLRVTMEWIISFTQPKIHRTQIYANRYTQLHQILANHYGCYKYDDLSEPVLDYIIHQGNNDNYYTQQSAPTSPPPPAKSTTATLSSSPTASWIMLGDDYDGSASSPLMVTASPKHHIDDGDDDLNPILPKQLLSYVQEHTHEYQTRLSRLEHMLEGACVDPRMLWKYPFAKSFVVGNGSLLSEEDVVRRIQDSEDEWRLLSRTLKRRLGVLL